MLGQNDPNTFTKRQYVSDFPRCCLFMTERPSKRTCPLLQKISQEMRSEEEVCRKTFFNLEL